MSIGHFIPQLTPDKSAAPGIGIGVQWIDSESEECLSMKHGDTTIYFVPRRLRGLLVAELGESTVVRFEMTPARWRLLPPPDKALARLTEFAAVAHLVDGLRAAATGEAGE